MARRNRRRLAQIERSVAMTGVLVGIAGYLLNAAAFEFVAVLCGVAALAFLVARNLLVSE